MKQGILVHGRVRLLLSKGHSCYNAGRKGRENENQSAAALSTTISQSSTWPSSRREKPKLKVLPTSKSPVDWVQREQTTSESSLLWRRVTQSPNTLFDEQSR